MYIALLCAVVGLWTIFRHGLSRNHYLSPYLIDLSSRLNRQGQTSLSHDEAVTICEAHSFAIEKRRQGERKIFDLVLLSTELDWLEIRLHTLAQYVDYFVVVESSTTFTGKPKPLYLKENWSAFKAFHDKIR